LFHNRVAREILGPEDALRGAPSQWTNVFGWYHADKTTLLSHEELPLLRALRGEEIDHEILFIRNASRPAGISINVTVKPMRDSNNRINAAVMVCRQVTEEQLSGQSRALLSQVVEQIADGVLLTDKQGRIEYVNPAFEVMTGFKPEDVRGQSPEILRCGMQDPDFDERIWHKLKSGRPLQATTTHRKKTGETYHVEETISPITDNAGNITHFVTVMQDVTAALNRQEGEVQLRLARQIQKKFYGVAPVIPGFDLAGAAYPAYETSGDYFDFIPLPHNRMGIAVGDVEGHGFGSALVMALTRAYVHSFAATGLEVDQILTQVNQMLVNDLGDGCFVTLMMASLDLETRSLVYAGAGHVPGYVLGPDGPVEHTLESSGPPLGLFPQVSYSRSPSITLQPGQILVLLTDGVTESEAPGGGEWGAHGALGYIRACGDHSALQLVDGLYREARRFAESEFQRDDITSVVVRVKPSADTDADTPLPAATKNRAGPDQVAVDCASQKALSSRPDPLVRRSEGSLAQPSWRGNQTASYPPSGK
jgi:PAS domain S-box-containing protein